MSWFLAFAGFASLIVLHEAGHFAAAKLTGMRVERFSLFFPPTLKSVRRGETEYAIGAIPLGGYVKITGMNPDEELSPDVAARAYYAQPVWKRVAVIAAGPAVNLVLALAIVWGLVMAFGTQQTGLGVYDVARNSPAHAALRVNDRILSVDGQALYREHPSEREFTREQAAMRALLDRHICPGAARTPGCRAATPVALQIRRSGRTLALSLVPTYDAALRRMRLGFSFGLHRYYGPFAALGQSASALWRVTTGTVDAVVTRFTTPSDHRLSGVVGAYETTRQAVQFGVADALGVLAVISLSLAIINLFPFLPLDGGHIFWALAEKLRGRAVSFQTMQRASVVGIVLVVYFAAVGLSSDIYHLRHGGFGVR